MAEFRSEKNPPEVSVASEIVREITGPHASEPLKRLFLALEAVRQQARTLKEEIAREFERLGLSLPDDEDES
jgi:hypothetical protein